MATSPDLHEPQIAAARAEAWHQKGDALLTLEAARDWVQQFGLVLFSPVASALGAPAPSLVEATLGEARTSATLAETATARSLAARLLSEGSALPLNLLGGPGDLPDFLVSSQAFAFVFTLRGDKGWKRPPETAGSVRVTPLALRVYELLAEKGAMTIAEIVPEIGREVTESAIGRALGELWQMLRVLPGLGVGEGETRWELTTARFLKAVKAGANAGQPTALSGLVSLYLAQVLVATEDEIAGFLSPLTARSRVREVLHGLGAGRQLAEAVIQGKTVLYVPEVLPDFARFGAQAEGEELSPVEAEAASGTEPGQAVETAPAERIRRFGDGAGGGKDRNFRGKPAARGGQGGRGGPRFERKDRGAGEGSRGFRAPREGGDRRPFVPRGRPFAAPGEDRPGGEQAGGERRGPAKPWVREQGARPARGNDRGDRPFRPRDDRRPPREGQGEERGSRPPRTGYAGGQFRERRQEGGDTGDLARAPRAPRPFRPREDGTERPFRPRREEGGSFDRERPRGPRPPRFNPEGEQRRPGRPTGGDRPFRPRPGTESGSGFRPRREDAGPSRGDRNRVGFKPAGRGFGDRPQGDRPFRPREDSGQGGGGDRRPPRRTFPPSRGGEAGGPQGDRRRSFGGDRGPRPGGPGGFRKGPKRPGAGGGAGFPGRPDRAARPPRKPRPEDEA